MMRRLSAAAAAALMLACYAPDARCASPAPVTSAPKPPASAIASATGIYDPALDARVEELLRRMTLEEKVGQLVQYSAGQPTGPGTGRTDYEDMIAKGQIGALFNISSAKDTNRFQKLAVEKSRLKIPIVFGLDVIHGFRTVFPVPLALASTWDPALVEQTARIAAREASAAGVRWTFSPMVDIARDARWGRITEGAGEDPHLGSVMAVAYVRGYQGSRLDAPDSVAATAKHFVGYGAAEGGRDYNTTEISEHTLRSIYLPPFRASVDAGVATIMSAFNTLNGVPTSANPFTLRQILRDEWGFRGVVDSDWDSVRELIQHGVAIDRETAALKGFMAGVDMDMVSSVYHDHLAGLVRAGKVPESRIDESVRYVLRLKFALGLFERPYADETRERTAMLRPDGVALAKLAAERSFVLLKNSAVRGAPLLPLAARTARIALIGPLADDLPSSLGAWPGMGKPEDVVSLRAELGKRVGEQHLVHHPGVGITGGSDEDLAGAVSAARRADTVILALGEASQTMTGEAASRTQLGLPGRQQELLERIVATGKPVVLVLFSGRPLTLPWAFENVPAVLAVWQPGVQTGPASVSTLFGESSPSGRLVVSWPRSVGQLPLYYNALNTGRPANKQDLTKPIGPADDKYVSKYLDERHDPQFPFGFGLSYTSFRYGPVQISGGGLRASELTQGLKSRPPGSQTVVTVSADVTNTGSRSGEEVVQLYVRLIGTSVAQPVRALKGFQRVSLAPGETRKVTFELTPEALASWNDRQQWVVEAAKVAIYISPDAAQGEPAIVQVAP
jgi:beta-glucosidase